MDAEPGFNTEEVTMNSSPSSFSMGFIIAIAMLSFASLVLSCLGCYYLYIKYQSRRLAEQAVQQRLDQQQEQEKQEEHKKEERAKNIKENLKVVNFSGSCEFSACTNSTAPTLWSNRSRRSDSIASEESGEISSESESDENENDQVQMVDLEAQVCSDSHTNHCCERDLEAQSDDDTENDDDGGDHDCPICFASFEQGDLVSISNHNECKHTFHKECITEWLLKQDGCPVCRRTYLEEAAETETKQDEETADATEAEQDEETADATSSMGNGELDC